MSKRRLRANVEVAGYVIVIGPSGVQFMGSNRASNFKIGRARTPSIVRREVQLLINRINNDGRD